MSVERWEAFSEEERAQISLGLVLYGAQAIESKLSAVEIAAVLISLVTMLDEIAETLDVPMVDHSVRERLESILAANR
jgi:hypothetical protein